MGRAGENETSKLLLKGNEWVKASDSRKIKKVHNETRILLARTCGEYYLGVILQGHDSIGPELTPLVQPREF